MPPPVSRPSLSSLGLRQVSSMTASTELSALSAPTLQPVTSVPATHTSATASLPINFPFPYTPYPSQQQLMQAVFDTLHTAPMPPPADATDSSHMARVAILESPTGTGKSLSLLCSTLHWLLDHAHRHTATAATAAGRIDAAEAEADEEVPDWVRGWSAEEKKKQQHEAERLLADKRQEIAALQPTQHHSAQHHTWQQRAVKRKDAEERAEADEEEDGDLLVEYVDDDDVASLPLYKQLLLQQEKEVKARLASAASASLLSHLHTSPHIIIASRTHSQLQQIVSELRKTVYHDRVRVVCLGGRKQLCQHDDVRRLSGQRMNDACIDMQKGKTNAKKQKDKRIRSTLASSALSSPCPYLDDARMSRLRDTALSHVHDIEQLHTLGSRLSACSYYATRALLPAAHVILLPYPALLHTATRHSLGLSDELLHGSVVVLDEAHNVMEAISALHSVSLTLRMLQRGKRGLEQYESRFRDRFKHSNWLYIKQTLHITTALLDYMQSSQQLPQPYSDGRVVAINDLLVDCGIEHINLFKLARFIDESELANKLSGFIDRYRAEDDVSAAAVVARGRVGEEGGVGGEESLGRGTNIVHALHAFLQALCNANEDGRVISKLSYLPSSSSSSALSSPRVLAPTSSLSFLMLNPSVPFLPLLRHARAVLLVGGTMQPFAHYHKHLLPSLPSTHLRVFSCSHVIPPSHILCLSFSTGPTSTPLLLSRSSQSQPAQLAEVSRILCNLVPLVPAGMVVFFPSYSLLSTVVAYWRSTTVWQQLNDRKRLFIDSPATATAADTLLVAYTAHIRNSTATGGGALLCSVVGGRLSEGINFSDDLCRCVVMVGMPYPNPTDEEVKAKRQWVEGQPPKAGGTNREGERLGREWYEGLCMRAVNQSIGRSVRHAADYACVVLVDERYGRASVQCGLPGWVRERSVVVERYGDGLRRVREFFRDKQSHRPPQAATQPASVAE